MTTSTVSRDADKTDHAAGTPPPPRPASEARSRPDVAQIRIRRPALDAAYELMDTYGLPKVVDVVGRALALWRFLQRRQEQGYTLLLRGPDGTLREPELVFLD